MQIVALNPSFFAVVAKKTVHITIIGINTNGRSCDFSNVSKVNSSYKFEICKQLAEHSGFNR